MDKSVVQAHAEGDMTDALEQAVTIISGGGILLYPTDTIYGLGCDALNVDAVKRVFSLKQRDEAKTALVLVGDEEGVRDLAGDLTPLASRLARCFWPGPLTMILRAKARLNSLVVTEAGTIAVRVPKHDFCRQLSKRAGVPILSTSANISGMTTAPLFSELCDMFRGKVDLMVDGGECGSILPSTIVDAAGEVPKIVREGAITSSQILQCLETI